MKKLFMIIFMFFMMTIPSFGAIVEKQLTATWEYPVTEEPYIASFEIRDQDGIVIASDIPANMRTSTSKVTINDEKVLAYALIVRGKDGTVSTPSNILIIQPIRHEIKGIGTFTIKLE